MERDDERDEPRTRYSSHTGTIVCGYNGRATRILSYIRSSITRRAPRALVGYNGLRRPEVNYLSPTCDAASRQRVRDDQTKVDTIPHTRTCVHTRQKRLASGI